MNFKDVIRAEASSVFLNTAEFGEEIIIEGVVTSAICDWSVQPEGEHLYGEVDGWGVNAIHAEITLAEDVIGVPHPGRELEINDRLWIVRTAIPQQGLLTLKLYRNVA